MRFTWSRTPIPVVDGPAAFAALQRVLPVAALASWHPIVTVAWGKAR